MMHYIDKHRFYKSRYEIYTDHIRIIGKVYFGYEYDVQYKYSDISTNHIKIKMAMPNSEWYLIIGVISIIFSIIIYWHYDIDQLLLSMNLFLFGILFSTIWILWARRRDWYIYYLGKSGEKCFAIRECSQNSELISVVNNYVKSAQQGDAPEPATGRNLETTYPTPPAR